MFEARGEAETKKKIDGGLVPGLSTARRVVVSGPLLCAERKLARIEEGVSSGRAIQEIKKRRGRETGISSSPHTGLMCSCRVE